MATLDIPSQYLAGAAPVVVTSPTTRCGTTLVQRLLSASDNALVYGEEIGNQFNILTRLFLNEIGECERSGEVADETFRRVLTGTLEDWRPGVTPPTDIRLRAWTHTYYQLPSALAEFGASIGRPVWGFKWPGCRIEMARGFLAVMPATKVVYVIRNLADALKSAKARRFVKTSQDAEGFCAQWATHMEAFQSLCRDDRVLFLRYETLVEERKAQVEALETFTGTINIRPDEFDIRVNTFAGQESDGHAPGQYIEPAPLTDEERGFIHRHAGTLMAELYPDQPLQA
jgi:hypothetical protein